MLARLARPALRPGARQALRYFATEPPKKPNDAEKSNGLLNDDLLEQAGMDTSEGESEKQKKWENTARRAREDSILLEKRTRRAWWTTGACFVAGLAYLVRPFDEEERKRHPEVKSTGWEPAGAWPRMRTRIGFTFDYFSEPSFDKLLPEPTPLPYGRPLTLVLALEDLLVKSEWTREHGWRTAKRPGLDYFLGYLAQYYEVVIWSDKYQAIDQEMIVKLDPLRASVSYSLFREATRYAKGKLIKDIRHLNRDPSKVIMVDVSKEAVSLQPENAFVLPKWKGNADDADLVRLIPLLEWIGAQPIKDVRPVIKSFEGKDVLSEFERRDKITRAKWQQMHGKRTSGNSLAGALLGVTPNKTADMMPQDVIRMEAQKSYKQFQDHVKEYGDKLMKEEEQKMKEAMSEHKLTLNKLITEGQPSQEDIAATLMRKEHEAQEAAKSN